MRTFPRIGQLFTSAGGKSRALIMVLTAFMSACGGGFDANNNPSSGSAAPGPTDSVAPVVISTSPANAAVNVGIDANLQITFSEPMDSSIVEGTTVKVRAGVAEVAGTVNCSYDTVTFTPADNWGFATTYTVTITGGPSGVRDVAGNVLAADYTWKFSTGQAPDTTSPTVTGKSPDDGDSGVSVYSPITVTFSEAVTNVTPATFRLTAGTAQVPGTVIDNGVVMFLPSSPLLVGTTYTATVTTGVTDLAGNHVASDYTWTFTTVQAIDTTPPRIIATSPVDGALGVSVDTTVIVSFSEIVTNVTPTTFRLSTGDARVPGTVSLNGSIATFRPLVPLSEVTLYMITVTTGVTDLSGNTLSSDNNWVFLTEGSVGGWW